MSLRAKQRDASFASEVRQDPDAFGYVLAETARIRCEQLIEAGDQRSWLRAVHRDLGLAAFHLSTSFTPEWRDQCLAAAREASDDDRSQEGLLDGGLREVRARTLSSAERRQLLRRMFDEAVAAATVCSEVVAESPAQHLRKAHVHALAAAAALDRRLGDLGALAAHGG